MSSYHRRPSSPRGKADAFGPKNCNLSPRRGSNTLNNSITYQKEVCQVYVCVVLASENGVGSFLL